MVGHGTTTRSGGQVVAGTTRGTRPDRERDYSPAVPGRKKSPAAGGRYDEREIAARVEALRRARGVEVKAICAHLGMEKWDWSRKVRLDRSSFTIDELGRIADFLAAPVGWPFVPTELGEILDRLKP